jgi:hypothetical protein
MTKIFKSSKDTTKTEEHYKMAIQPIDFILENDIPFAEGNVIKYICRHKKKNGIEDLRKAKQYIDYIIEKEYEGN